MSLYGASRFMIASQEIHSKRVFLGELNATKGNGSSEFTWLQSGARDAKTYLDDYPSEVSYASLSREQWKTLALEDSGHTVPVNNLAAFSQLRQLQSFDSVVTVAFTFGTDWRGRAFLFNPTWGGEQHEELRFLLDIGPQAGPATHSMYLFPRLHRRAYAAQ